MSEVRITLSEVELRDMLREAWAAGREWGWRGYGTEVWEVFNAGVIMDDSIRLETDAEVRGRCPAGHALRMGGKEGDDLDGYLDAHDLKPRGVRAR